MKETLTDQMLHEMLAIQVNKANLKYIAETGKLNGGLLMDLRNIILKRKPELNSISELVAENKELREALELCVDTMDVLNAMGQVGFSNSECYNKAKSALTQNP